MERDPSVVEFLKTHPLLAYCTDEEIKQVYGDPPYDSTIYIVDSSLIPLPHVRAVLEEEKKKHKE